jgi:type I restriction-modification system DNA methylase subunit
MVKEKAETKYEENPDFYDEFFVPERARWSYLQEKLGDANEPYGSTLDKALGQTCPKAFGGDSLLMKIHCTNAYWPATF